jgi:hypothetical protein
MLISNALPEYSLGESVEANEAAHKANLQRNIRVPRSAPGSMSEIQRFGPIHVSALDHSQEAADDDDRLRDGHRRTGLQ